MTSQTSAPLCCLKFDPTPWDGKTFTWENKKFIHDTVLALFYMPLNFGSIMTKLHNQVEKAGALCPDGLCLSDHVSMWNVHVYLAVDKEIPNAQNVTLSGNYLSRVYEGDFKKISTWTKDFEVYAKEKGYNVKKLYMWYTTCPKCAKEYGKNYVVIMGQLG